MIYGDTQRSCLELPSPAVPRAEVIDELVGVLVDSTEAIHSGAWATATLEVCLGILASAIPERKSQCRISAAYRRDSSGHPK